MNNWAAQSIEKLAIGHSSTSLDASAAAPKTSAAASASAAASTTSKFRASDERDGAAAARVERSGVCQRQSSWCAGREGNPFRGLPSKIFRSRAKESSKSDHFEKKFN